MAEIFGLLLQAMRQNVFPTMILVLHIGAALEAGYHGDGLRALYFTGGAVLTLSVVLMGVSQ